MSQLIDRVNISDDRTLPYSMPNLRRWLSVASRPIRSFLQERSLATCTFSSTTNLIMRDKVPMLSPRVIYASGNAFTRYRLRVSM